MSYMLNYTPEMQAQYDNYVKTGQMPANTSGSTFGPLQALSGLSGGGASGATSGVSGASGGYTNFAAQLEALRNGTPSAEVFGGGVAGGMPAPTGGKFASNANSFYGGLGIDQNANPFQGQLEKAFGGMEGYNTARYGSHTSTDAQGNTRQLAYRPGGLGGGSAGGGAGEFMTQCCAASRAMSSNSGCALSTRPSRRAILKRTSPTGVATCTVSRAPP